MRCIKLLGDDIMALDVGRRVAGLQIRANVLNRFTALEIPKSSSP